VLESIVAVGYKVSTTRRASTTQKTVALLITDILNPFFPEIVRGVQDEARVDNTALLLCDSAEDPQWEQKILTTLANQSVDGVIVCASRLATQDLIAFHDRYRTPMVVVNRRIGHPDIPCIVVDFASAAYVAGRHLVNLGHTRIAYLAGPSATEASQVRRMGLEQAMQEANLTLDPELCLPGFPNVEGGFQAASVLLSMPENERPTAIMCYNDIVAIGALQAIRAHNLRVPEDISVVGFDDIAMAAHTNPPLTTIDQPKHRLGKLAMRMVRQMLQGEAIQGKGYTLVESPLVVRESTGSREPS
jgi:DNA-binding LacI/PurR family transcriptional regulator